MKLSGWLLLLVFFGVSFGAGSHFSKVDGKDASEWKSEYDSLSLYTDSLEELNDARVRFDGCVEHADTIYLSNWNFKCEILQLEDNCTLPRVLADDLEQKRVEAKELCVKLYKE